jgi:hypothetical protein
MKTTYAQQRKESWEDSRPIPAGGLAFTDEFLVCPTVFFCRKNAQDAQYV